MTNAAGTLPADSPASACPPGLLRALLNAFVFIAACAAGCGLIGRCAPFPEVPGVGLKLAHFREHRDEFEVLFLGSSRFFHQIIPEQFDAALAAGGRPLRSFNFGYDGMWPPESYYVLRQILGLHPARLRWVFIDLMDLNTRLDDRNNSTLRMTYWHDLPHTALTFREIVSTRWPWHRKVDFLRDHARLCVTQVLNLGRGAEVLANLFSPRPVRRHPWSWALHAGYDVGPETGLEGAARESFLAAVEPLKAALPPQPVRPVFRDALHDLIADVRRAGAEPIFVIAPTINGSENFSEVPDGAAVFALNQPNEYPELFDPAKHYDFWHLNPQGAVDFTAILARKFLERLHPRP